MRRRSFLFLVAATLPDWGRALVKPGVLEDFSRQYGSQAVRRLNAWRELMDEISGLPLPSRLTRTNAFFNQLAFAEDGEQFGSRDYWATPLEFLGRGRGDCEEFAIAKYVTLVKGGVALQASTAYTNLWRAGTQYEIAQQARQAHETLVDQIGRRVETGVSGEAELIQVQGRLSLSQSNESAALNALQDARANYRRVVGKLPDFEVAKTMLDWDRPPFLDMAVQNAFRDHPIIKVAEADIQEATALRQSAQGSQLPRITLELGANRNRDLDGTPGTSKDRFAMLRMNWDLYNGGSNMAAERAAGFRLSEAEHLLNDAQREVVELAHQAWNAYMTTKQQLVYLDMFVESAVNTREAYAQQFTINRRTLQEVLDSEVEVFDARSARVEAEADHVIADLQLAASQGQLLQVMQQIN
jgi:adhesin transport system outer membrane protein